MFVRQANVKKPGTAILFFCKLLFKCWLLIFSCGALSAGTNDGLGVNAGFFYDQFELTLAPGTRTEIAGPLYFNQKGEDELTWGFPPFVVRSTNFVVDAQEFDILYPVFTYDRFGTEKRWQFFQIINHSWGGSVDYSIRSRITLFPIYFHQRSDNPDRNYTAVWPIAGHLDYRFYYKKISFVLWPLWVKTEREGSVSRSQEDEFTSPFFRWRQERRIEVTTYNVLAPFFHYRVAPGLKGYQALPFFKWEQKEITTRTNKWDEHELVPGYKHLTILWPLFYRQDRKLGTSNEEKFRAFLPFYSILRSPQRDSSTYGWPIGLTITDDRARHYHEVGAPWPFIVFANGEGKTTRRVWPFFSHSENEVLESAFLLWPIWKYNAIHAETLDRRRKRILFYLYSDTIEENRNTGEFKRRMDFWPLFTRKKEMDGRTRLQILALLEPIMPNVDSIERNYSPLWSIWLSENNPRTGASSRSFLWNLYRREAAPKTKKVSLLFGLFQYQSDAKRSRVRLFYIPISNRKTQAEASDEV